MFRGIRYTDALAEAAHGAYPNFYPYRFQKGEHDPTGKGKATIPYLMSLADETLVRIKGSGDAPWYVQGDQQSGYTLHNDDNEEQVLNIRFEPLPNWMQQQTSDGFPMAQAGVSLHGDMAVINVAPGCDYFLEKHNGESMRCRFCAYGAPDERTAHLGQVANEISLPALTYQRMQETLQAAIAEAPIRHIYLVGGSMTDWEAEGKRFLEIARVVQQTVQHKIPISCGSGALPDDILQQFKDENLVDNVCFNLEVWSEQLFENVCPGKNRFVGYHRWISALEKAVSLWGRGRVYSAMVAGIELEPEYDMSWEQAADIAIRGADDLCQRGIIPIYSLYWPVGGRDHPEYMHRLWQFFEKLNTEYEKIRRKHNLRIWEGFMCHRCAYMQMECDIDRS
jgi:hypothetical protein